jgi:protein-tyrosine sulfotransferase
MENVEGAQYIFIGGVPRSGTSIFQKILDGHSQIYGGPEFDHIYTTLKLYSNYKNGVEVTKRQKHYYSEKEVLQRFRTLLNDFLSTKLNQEKVTYLSEKTPSNLLVFHQLKEIFPKSKFIWVIRDPRANLFSFKKNTTTK